jgi:hypothetical protein
MVIVLIDLRKDLGKKIRRSLMKSITKTFLTDLRGKLPPLIAKDHVWKKEEC